MYIDEARATTDEILSAIERRIESTYDRAIDELDKAAAKFWKDFDRQDRKWWKKMQADPDNKALEDEWRRWRRDQLLTGERFDPIREECIRQIENARYSTLSYVNGRMAEVYALNYNNVGSTLYEGLAGYSFSLMDAATVRNLALTDNRLLPYRVVDGKKVASWSSRSIRAEITQGIIQGDSIPNIAKRLGRVVDMDAKAATRTARTMVTSAENKGRMDALHKAEEDGIQLVKKWIATNDNRTRDAHAELDGVEIPMDEPFVNSIGPIMFPGDPDADPENVYNCRCALAARVIGFKGR